MMETVTDLEIYAPGLREPENLVKLEAELGAEAGLCYKADVNHDIVYFELDKSATTTLSKLMEHFERAGLEPRLVGERPEGLARGGDTQRLAH